MHEVSQKYLSTEKNTTPMMNQILDITVKKQVIFVLCCLLMLFLACLCIDILYTDSGYYCCEKILVVCLGREQLPFTTTIDKSVSGATKVPKQISLKKYCVV